MKTADIANIIQPEMRNAVLMVLTTLRYASEKARERESMRNAISEDARALMRTKIIDRMINSLDDESLLILSSDSVAQGVEDKLT